jgi:hypothetical protein
VGIGVIFSGAVVRSYRKELWFEVPARRALINITPEVNAFTSSA